MNEDGKARRRIDFSIVLDIVKCISFVIQVSLQFLRQEELHKSVVRIMSHPFEASVIDVTCDSQTFKQL